MNTSGRSCRLRDLFKRRVNEKGRVSRRQSGASNRISGLESDTPSTKPRSFYTGEGDGDLAFHCTPSLSGRLRRTATMDNKGKRDRPCSVLRPRNHDPFVSLENILCWQATDASCQKEERRGLLCTDVTRRNTITVIGPRQLLLLLFHVTSNEEEDAPWCYFCQSFSI